LPASDIATYIGEGNVDVGITGLDVVKESEEQDVDQILVQQAYSTIQFKLNYYLSTNRISASANAPCVSKPQKRLK
jgi:ATP phosphoribosyltransferase